MTNRQIPVIDLAGFGEGSDAVDDRIAAQVDAACREVGFLVVVGHGVDPDLVARMRATTWRFFELPEAKKLEFKMPPDRYRGYTAMHSESLSASYGQEMSPDIKESFSIGPTLGDAQDGEYFRGEAAGAFFAPNIWPDQPPEMAAVWTEYYAAMEGLATKLMRVFALSLGLDRHHFDGLIDRHITNMSAIHYPPLSAPAKPGQLRGGAHTDFGSLTIVQRDQAPGGLQVLIDGEWVDAPYVADSFVVNLGDLMAEWTNDRWVSTVHRVALPPPEAEDTDRLSFTFFHQPNYDAAIETIPTCLDGGTSSYATITSGDHIRKKLAAMRSPQDAEPVG